MPPSTSSQATPTTRESGRVLLNDGSCWTVIGVEVVEFGFRQADAAYVRTPVTPFPDVTGLEVSQAFAHTLIQNSYPFINLFKCVSTPHSSTRCQHLTFIYSLVQQSVLHIHSSPHISPTHPLIPLKMLTFNSFIYLGHINARYALVH